MDNESVEKVAQDIVENLKELGQYVTSPGMPSGIIYDSEDIAFDWLEETISEALYGVMGIAAESLSAADREIERLRKAVIDGFVARILHGDEQHQQWLKDEAVRYLNGGE